MKQDDNFSKKNIYSEEIKELLDDIESFKQKKSDVVDYFKVIWLKTSSNN